MILQSRTRLPKLNIRFKGFLYPMLRFYPTQGEIYSDQFPGFMTLDAIEEFKRQGDSWSK